MSDEYTNGDPLDQVEQLMQGKRLADLGLDKYREIAKIENVPEWQRKDNQPQRKKWREGTTEGFNMVGRLSNLQKELHSMD